MPANPTAPDHGHAGHADLAADPRALDELLDEVSVGLSGSLNLRRTALRLITMLRPRLADWSAVVLQGVGPGTLMVVGGDDAGFHEIVSESSVRDLCLGRVMRTGRTELLHVALDDGAQDALSAMILHPRLAAEAATLRPADVLGVGLTARGTTIGALVMVRGQGRGFGPQDVAVAERVATHAAMALDSARLYEERARIATVLQSSLRPPSLPRIDGVQLAARYRPAADHLDIGGDFYDVHGVDGDWLLLLGDVTGKGVEAAALTGRTRLSIRTASYFDRRPDALLGALNKALFDERTRQSSEQFITAVCARMRRDDAGGLVIDFAAAGHPAPIVLRPGGWVQQVDVSGIAAGLQDAAVYQPATVHLDPGDTVLMFTDGIDEAKGADGLYGVDRLMALLSAYTGADPEVICDAVEQNVLEYLDGRPHDDIALLAVTCAK